MLCREERNGPTVVRGRRHHANPLRCDLILASGSRRVCVVSLPSAAYVTPRQLARCTHLRDRALCRVAIVYGTPPAAEYLDFGRPGCAHPPAWYGSLAWMETMDDAPLRGCSAGAAERVGS